MQGRKSLRWRFILSEKQEISSEKWGVRGERNVFVIEKQESKMQESKMQESKMQESKKQEICLEDWEASSHSYCLNSLTP